jgi:V/A-type H+-transporting ATPase subunit C
MLEKMSALAMVPKAKAIDARRLTRTDYAELARKRSVLEITAALQAHPYFSDSLKGLSQTNLHRAQIEEMLRKDVFYKYETLMRYSFHKSRFGGYFLMRAEVSELLTKLRLMSLGFKHHYIIELPGFLADKTSFSLIKLAEAETPADCLKVLVGTPYERILRDVMPKDGQKLDYLACEHAFLSYYYTTTLAEINHSLSKRVAEQTRELFCIQAEIYNLDLLYRAKTFYNDQFPPLRLRGLLLPVYGALSPRQLYQLASAKDGEEFLHLYAASPACKAYGMFSADPMQQSDLPALRRLSHSAERLLHFSSEPQPVLVALLTLAELQRSNIINIIEGVRYGLPPDQIMAFLKC